MEKRREEERIRAEAMDKKFGFSKSVGFVAPEVYYIIIAYS